MPTMNEAVQPIPVASRRSTAFWLVLLAAGGTFAVTMGARQSMAIFLGTLNSTTGLGLASISLAFAGGAGMAGPSVLMAAATRLVAPERRGMATGLVNAGGSFGQFLFVPIAQGITAA